MMIHIAKFRYYYEAYSFLYKFKTLNFNDQLILKVRHGCCDSANERDACVSFVGRQSTRSK